MSSTWEYADLPAAERLDMIRNGNKDVYDSEVARSLDKIKQYENAGISTDAQKEWLDTLGYNYNLYIASQQGESLNNVAKNGYAETYFGVGSSDQSGQSEVAHVQISNKATFEHEVEKLTEEYTKLINDVDSQIKIAEEWLINNGIEKESIHGQKYIKLFEETFSARKKKYYNDYVTKINELVRQYY